MPGELALEAIEAMLDAAGVRSCLTQQLERVLSRHLQVLRSMLVMDRQRFARLSSE